MPILITDRLNFYKQIKTLSAFIPVKEQIKLILILFNISLDFGMVKRLFETHCQSLLILKLAFKCSHSFFKIP